MNDLWKTFRLGIYVFALPLAATAAASAHQWLTEANAIVTPELPAVSTVSGIAVHRNHTVRLDGNGAINGRVALIDSTSKAAAGLGGLKAYLVQGGEIVQQVYTDAQGYFVMQGIAEGAYSFIAAGETGFVAYGVHVVSGDAGEAANVMEAAAVSPRFVAVREVLEKYVPDQIAEEILRLSGEANVAAGKVVGANRVQLVDGQLSGSVMPIFGPHASVEGTYVNIIKDDVTIAEAQVDGQGNFTIDDFEPGVYDFVAAGQSGFAAVSFEAIEGRANGQEVPVSAPTGAEVSENDGAADTSVVEFASQDVVTADIPMSLDVGLTSPYDGGFVAEQVQYACDTCAGEIYPDQGYEIAYAGEACGYGCAAGGACGGCGNFSGYGACCGPGGGFGGRLFGGGFGGGRLLGLTTLGLAVTALATDGNPGTPPDPGTPSRP